MSENQKSKLNYDLAEDTVRLLIGQQGFYGFEDDLLLSFPKNG